ncbi:hypothetical protein L1987_08437 [Smallanthus sonchifolius]|uniref:Uncharacterized protein n=1 Tax=Smallanthus sonchifolius TaxID=185202 RepID=A0ACB9JMD4_9ASTR|nr:hypothetical protein L1987_08437 [Smallanthus sonchifolius]
MKQKVKMINNTCDQEGNINLQNLSAPNPTSRPYPCFKNPRIPRIWRDYGAKDRHTKVWTIKGLKDRRIRLSTSAALQLYRLQDQLGLSQPSKVIDWLLDVTKDDIGKLPPLQMALEDFNIPFHFPSTFVHQDFSSTQLSFSPFFNAPLYDHQRTKGKEVSVENRFSSCSCNDFQPSSNISLSRFSHHPDTYASQLPSSLASSYESQHLSSFSGTVTPSFCPQYSVHNHFQLLNSSSSHVSVPHNLIDTQSKVVFGSNIMTSKGSSESNGESK